MRSPSERRRIGALPEPGVALDLVGTLERDLFQGLPRLRIRVVDYADSAAQPAGRPPRRGHGIVHGGGVGSARGVVRLMSDRRGSARSPASPHRPARGAPLPRDRSRIPTRCRTSCRATCPGSSASRAACWRQPRSMRRR